MIFAERDHHELVSKFRGTPINISILFRSSGDDGGKHLSAEFPNFPRELLSG